MIFKKSITVGHLAAACGDSHGALKNSKGSAKRCKVIIILYAYAVCIQYIPLAKHVCVYVRINLGRAGEYNEGMTRNNVYRREVGAREVKAIVYLRVCAHCNGNITLIYRNSTENVGNFVVRCNVIAVLGADDILYAIFKRVANTVKGSRRYNLKHVTEDKVAVKIGKGVIHTVISPRYFIDRNR